MASRARVALFTNVIPPYRVRPYELVSDGLDGDFSVVSYSARERGRQWEVVTGGFRSITLPGIQVRIRHNRVVHVNWRVSQVLAELRPAVVLTTGFGPTALKVFWTGRRSGAAHIPIMDGWAFSDELSATWLHRLLRRWVVGGSAAGVAAGKKAGEWFESYGMPADRVFLSPLSAPLPQPAEVPSFDDRPYDVLWVGNINDSHKGADFFCEVVELLHANRPGIRVRVAGTGHRERHLRRRFGEVGVQCKFDGFLQPPAVQEAFASARIFLFPTRVDAWGLVANEAAQAGTPSIVTPYAGAAGELIRDGSEGFVIAHDSREWVKRILRLLSDKALWRTMSVAARAASSSRTAEASARGLLAAIRFAHPQRDN